MSDEAAESKAESFALEAALNEADTGIAGAPPNPPHTARNWVLCISLCIIVGVFCFWQLDPLEPTYEDRASSVVTLIFHALVGCFWTFLIVVRLTETRKMEMTYRVMGQPEIPVVQHSFQGIGRWTMFTFWSNTLFWIYNCLSTIYDVMLISGMEVPFVLMNAIGLIWQVVFPISFMVNMVVTFALVPAMRSERPRLWLALEWKGICFHNWFCMLAAVEAALVAPTMSTSGDFPLILLYGLAYAIFAYFLFLRTGVYHYFFMDPRFKYAPIALVALLAVLAFLYFLGGFLVNAAKTNVISAIVIIYASLLTCTWRYPFMVAQTEPFEDVGTFKLLQKLLTSSPPDDGQSAASSS